MNKSRLLGAVCACIFSLVGTTQQANAALITTPSGLSAGDKYRLVFVTSGTRDATSSNIADYNTFVTNAANAVPELAALGTQWFVIGSTPLVNVRDNTGTSLPGGLPIFLLNDTKLVDDYSDLWDNNIDVPLNRTEMDTEISGRVFSGSDGFGATDGLALGNTTLGRVTYGLSNSANGQDWIRTQNEASDIPLHFYAISGELTAVPVPAAVWLFGSGLLGMIGIARRKRAA